MRAYSKNGADLNVRLSFSGIFEPRCSWQEGNSRSRSFSRISFELCIKFCAPNCCAVLFGLSLFSSSVSFVLSIVCFSVMHAAQKIMGTTLIVTRVTPMRRNRSIGWQNTRLLKKSALHDEILPGRKGQTAQLFAPCLRMGAVCLCYLGAGKPFLGTVKHSRLR